MAKGQVFFGHKELAEQLEQRLIAHFAAESAADSSLAIGIFGEWGSGKSNLLQLIREDFAAKLKMRMEREDGDESPPVVVVAFNPWRYEKEEHLLVPLLKTLQLVIEQHLRDHEPFWEKLGLLEKLKEGMLFLAIAAMAFMSAFKFKFGMPELGIELDSGRGLDTAMKLLPLMEPEENPSPLAKLDSHYYEFEQRLREFTAGNNPVRLLFLIDDLDRCLPEKAVEMLESIKLFLDVDGCAFVLALDEEVVERGIVHRYRDYIFQGQGQRVDEKSLAQLPITGPEYLEKIIHLPFRLPQPSRPEIRKFLLEKYPELFGSLPAEPEHKAAVEEIKGAGRMAAGKESPQQADELLSLFVNHIPPVPRKQVRTAELVLLLLGMAKARHCEHRIRPLPLAKLTLLQLYAPDLYRFGRRRFQGFLQTLQEWASQENWAQRDFGKKLETRIKMPESENGVPSESQQVEARNFDRFYAPLIEALELSAHNRSGFDPFLFIKSYPLAAEDLRDVRGYFSFVDEASLGEAAREAAILAGEEAPALPVAELANVDEFLDLLFSRSEGSWQSALHAPELDGRVLSDKTFELMAKRLEKPDFKPLLKNINWLRGLVACLSREQFIRLASMADNFRELLPKSLPENPTSEEAGALLPQAEFLAMLRPDQQAVLAEAVEPARRWLTGLVESHRLDPEPRAQAGRILGELGDPRPGVTVKKQDGRLLLRRRGERRHALPDIDWVEIPAGRFRMGTEGEEGSEQEKPAHEVDVKRFFVSRCPVTNAQYDCFVRAGIYEDEDFWRERLPKAAGFWREGGAADEKLLESIENKDLRENYRRWLEDDKNRTLPRLWTDKQWNLDNHPVVGVSWFEALAYSIWLNELLPEIEPAGATGDMIVRLPSEDEWEYAARGKDGWRYAWGNDAGTALGNYSDTKIGRTTAAGLFSPGKAFGLHDVSGNVWEWTLSRWGTDVQEPDFTYNDWKKQERQRNLVEPVAFRVVRGGSWGNDAGDVRCAYRVRDHPCFRDYDLGFRVVCGGVLPGSDS